MQTLQNRALRKVNFKQFHHPIKYIYRDHRILKFAGILKVQNCLFMYHVEQNSALATSFPALHSKGKHNYQTITATQLSSGLQLSSDNSETGITSKRSSRNHQKTNSLIWKSKEF